MTEPSPPLNQSIIQKNSTIIVGLSGGPDSIYLLHQLVKIAPTLGISIIAAHLDHEWQESSQSAAQLCQKTCNFLQVNLIIKKLSELKFNIQWNGSQEELGRKMRRHFFETVAQEYNASAIALAHHQQDHHETFFIRLLRGSSITGLTGIKESNGLYIHPLLNCPKQTIVDYLELHNIPFYTDPTNISDDYLRNRIRNHVIPALQHADSRFKNNLTSTMQQLKHVDDFLDQYTTQTLTEITIGNKVALQPFLVLHPVIQQRILLRVMIQEDVQFTPSQKIFNEIMRFLTKSAARKHTIHNTWAITKTKDLFAVVKDEKSDKTL